MILAILLVETQTIKVELSKQPNGVDFGQAAPWLVALAALGFSVYQYYANTHIKRLEYLDGLAKKLREDPLIRVATQMLDWEVRTIDFEGEKCVYSFLMLERALTVHITEGKFGTDSGVFRSGFAETEKLIRDAFDAFFDFTENIQYAVDLNVITEDDIYQAPLVYYFRKLCEKDTWTNCAICKYLEAYGFPKTEQLLRSYRQRSALKIPALTRAQIADFEQLEASAHREAMLKKGKRQRRTTLVFIDALASHR